MNFKIILILFLVCILNCATYMVHKGIGVTINRNLLKNYNEIEQSIFLYSVEMDSAWYARRHFEKKDTIYFKDDVLLISPPWVVPYAKIYDCKKYSISIMDSLKAKIDSLKYFKHSDFNGAVIHHTFIDTGKSSIIARKNNKYIEFITPINVFKDSITIDFTNYPTWIKKRKFILFNKIGSFFKYLFIP